MEEHIIKDGKSLRLGYTTGTCAAAAAKAAAYMLLIARPVSVVKIETPKGLAPELEICDIEFNDEYASCSVIKDSGDDPDVTNGTKIFAHITRIEEGVIIDGGEGIGRVTKEGLDQPVGAAAINSVPRKMIEENVRQICTLAGYDGGLKVVISAPDGEALAKKTFNPRLGIIGGISILGTSGIVEPMSEQALIDTIAAELSVRKAGGTRHALLTPGNYGADFIRDNLRVDPTIPVMISNFVGDALDICRRLEFEKVLLIGHIGKLIKIAGGMLNTHSKYGDNRMQVIAEAADAAGANAADLTRILDCATCDAALHILDEKGLRERVMSDITGKISRVLAGRAGAGIETGAILFSKEYGQISETENARDLLQYILKDYSGGQG